MHGRVAERNGRPRIEIREPASISIVGGGESRRPAGEGTASGRRIVSTRSSLGTPDPEGADPALAAAKPAGAGGVAARLPEGLAGETAQEIGAPTATGRGDSREEAASALAERTGADEVSAPDPVPVDRGSRSRSRLVPGGSAGRGSSFAAGGRVRVEVAPPQTSALTAEDAAARLGFPVESGPGDGAPLGGAGELALLRQEIAALSERLAEVEGAIGEVAERVAGLESVVAPALAERQARADSVGPAPAPRSGSPALRRVKRGYSAKQVLRVLGEPIQVESNPNGQYTWYYEGGRVVTIGAGGIVTSAVGF